HDGGHAVATAVVQNVQAADVAEPGQCRANPAFVIEVGGILDEQRAWSIGKSRAPFARLAVVEDSFVADGVGSGCHGGGPSLWRDREATPGLNAVKRTVSRCIA